MNSWLSLLALVLSCVVVEAFFVMLEMACVSFNKVRLEYYISRKSKRARWLSYLLNHPARLFGTTLIASNLALLIGSEASRRFYESVGFSPDLAPLTQVALVVIFAEMAPMFAARKHPEHVAMFGVPVLYFFSLLFLPIIKILDFLSRFVNRLFGVQRSKGIGLSREELQKILEEHEEGNSFKKEQFNTVVANIFALKKRLAKDLMKPLNKVQMVPSHFALGELRNLLSVEYSSFVPVYHRNYQNILGIAYPRDLIKVDSDRRIKDHMRSAWFITENQSILDILKQFRRNNHSVAIVLNKSGLSVGLITLDEVIDMIFDRSDEWMAYGDLVPKAHQVLVERIFDAQMLIEDFNKTYETHLVDADSKTLEDIFINHLGHVPTKGETVRIDQFELVVEESTLRGPKTILVKTLST